MSRKSRSIVMISGLVLLMSARLGAVAPPAANADRGPRFLRASANGSSPTAIDASQVPMLREQVTLDLQNVPLDAALQAIAAQSGVRLVYSGDVVPLDTRTSIRTEGITVAAALSQVLLDASVDVVIAGSHAALVRQEPAPAPPPRPTGTLTGRVTQAGEPVAGVTVTATSESLKEPRVVTTGDDGTYHFAELAPGAYSLRFELEGLVPVVKEIQVSPDESSTLDIQMSLHEVREEVVVTGSRIRGTDASAGTRVEVIDRQEIERSGFATTQQVVQSLPQNFQGGQNEDTFVGAAGSNVTAGSSVNLRGIGADKTLLLVNGRRMPVAGVNTDFVDVSSIPLTAIDRVEVLPDGASAIYGSDAISGVVNIILRKEYEGAETRLRNGAVTQGGLDEFRFGQVFGKSWDSGNALLSYEYYNRDPLPNTERGFAADSDLTPFGGDNFSTEFSNPGNILDPETFEPVFAIPRGQDGTSLTPGDLLPGAVNFQNDNAFRNLQNDQERHAAFATFSQDLGESLRLFAEGRYTTRDFHRRIVAQNAILAVPSSNPFFVDPFGGSDAVTVSYNLGNDLGPLFSEGSVKTYDGLVGGSVTLGGDWQLELFASLGREDTELVQGGLVDFAALTAALADPDPATAFNPFGDGSHTNPATLEAIRENPSTETSDSRVQSANVITDGSLFHMPGGDVKLAAGLNYLRETYDTTTTQESADERFTREVASAFAELLIPLVSQSNRKAGLERLALSIAGRFDDYSDVGTTTNPKIGAAWSPVNGLNVRSTWGTSFKVPKLADFRDQFDSVLVLALPDPSSPDGSRFALVRFGSNLDLKNETAEAWTAGLDFAPQALSGLSLGLTYFNNGVRDRIATPRNVFTVLVEEDRFSSIITRNPSREEIDALCDSAIFDPVTGDCTLPIAVIVDARRNNTAITKINGLDFTLDYGFDTPVGDFVVGLNGSYLLNFKEAITATAPTVNIVSTVNQPIDFRMRNSVSWSHASGFGITAFINHADSYVDNISSPERKIDSWTTADLTLEWNTQQRFANSWVGDSTLALSILNIFDTDPPFVNNPQGVGYDPENADPLGRFISFNIRKSW